MTFVASYDLYKHNNTSVVALIKGLVGSVLFTRRREPAVVLKELHANKACGCKLKLLSKCLGF